MAKVSKPCDVFVANSASEAPLASVIADVCRASGLEAITNTDLPLEMDTGDAVRDALAESRALIIILAPSGPTASMLIEIGAAQAWNKPIFGVIADPAMVHLPPVPSDVKIYPSNRVEEIISAIQKTARQLTDPDRSLLAELFRESGATIDQLILEPQVLERLTGQFARRTGRTVPEERLHSELLRMRKEGRLTKNRAIVRSKPRARSN
jgi:hypothetical protein